MLRHLQIRDILIIERLSLDFTVGLNVLTGETGAGKSILLDSLGFVLGWRGRADLVRQGVDQGEVTAVFDITRIAALRDVLSDLEIEAPEGELILRRVNGRDGRKTAWVNDRRVSGEALRRISEHLVELHGQHDDRGLLDQNVHRDLLDEFGGLTGLRTQVSTAWQEWQAIQKKLKYAREGAELLKAEEEFLRHALKELDDLDPQVGEESELDQNRRLMQASEKISADIDRANQALSNEGAEGQLTDALRWLEGASDQAEGRLDDAIDALGRVLNELAEAQSGVSHCLDSLRFDPQALELCEERLFAIRALARKHSVQPDELPDLAENFRGKLNALDTTAGDLATMEAQVTEAHLAYNAVAKQLTQARRDAAHELDGAMGQELAPLKMENAQFITDVSEASPSAEGADAVAFRVITNPGAPAGPIAKIASGGELSRFLLALKVCLTRGQSGITMIFDEIDRGVGGATADAVGRRLKALSNGGQVLVVTHSPQVAALGAHHMRVAKHVNDGMTLSDVEMLTPDARVDEIARMLAGDIVTDAARQAAAALLTARH